MIESLCSFLLGDYSGNFYLSFELALFISVIGNNALAARSNVIHLVYVLCSWTPTLGRGLMNSPLSIHLSVFPYLAPSVTQFFLLFWLKLVGGITLSRPYFRKKGQHLLRETRAHIFSFSRGTFFPCYSYIDAFNA